MLDQGCGRDASPDWVGRQFLADTHASELQGNTGTITNMCIFVDEILAVLDTTILIVNIELTKINITAVINLKWHNLPSTIILVI
jgi:hypothetical protein